MKKYKKAILDMTKSGMVLGVGSHAVGKASGNAAGLTNISKFMPMMGNVIGAGTVLKLMPKIKKRKR